MSSLADRAIAALRANHDTLAALVPTLTEDQLTGPSGAVGVDASPRRCRTSAAVPRSAASRSRPPRGSRSTPEDNQTIWARWDGSTPADQAAGFVEHDAAYLDTVEG